MQWPISCSKIFKVEIPTHYFSIIMDEFNANINIKIFINKDWLLEEIEINILPVLNEINAKLLDCNKINFVQYIWLYFKRFLDFGFYLIYLEPSVYKDLLSKHETLFDLNTLLHGLKRYDINEITQSELFSAFQNIVASLLELNFYTK
jgi:hypothetical protein